MDINKCIEVLRRPNSFWQFSRKNIENKIAALSIIKSEENFYYVTFLMDFLKDDSLEVSQTTCDTIIYLFKRANSKNELYRTLKYCNISTNDIEFYERNFSMVQLPILLGIASFNHNGYVRQKAAACLANISDPEAIRFLLYRLADWVKPVRQSALQGIENFKSIRYLDNLIDNLPTLELLQKTQRVDLGNIYLEIGAFITEKNREQTKKNFPKYSDKSRFLLAKSILASRSDDFREILFADKYFLIRSLALNHFENLNDKEITTLLKDKSTAIRLHTLRKLINNSDFDTLLLDYVADDSASIRYFSRFTLKNKVSDFAEIYHQNLTQGKQIVGSLSGLAEVSGKQYTGSIKTFLENKKTKTIRTAFLALRKLEPDAAYAFAVSHLDSEIQSIRNTSIDLLSKTPNTDVLAKAREYFKAGNQELRKAMMNLFHKIGGWAAIPDIMLGTIDEDKDIRQISYENLQIWKAKAIRLFTSPKESEIEKANQIFKYVFEVHQTKKYFKDNPVDGLNFYLR